MNNVPQYNHTDYYITDYRCVHKHSLLLNAEWFIVAAYLMLSLNSVFTNI